MKKDDPVDPSYAAWLRPGVRVDYHSIIGGPITQANAIVSSHPWQLGHGAWVVKLEDKSGCVGIEALTPNPEYLNRDKPLPTKNADLAIPEGLSKEGKAACDVILSVLTAYGRTHTGGSKAFHTPERWKELGHSYGKGSVLIVAHDGGDVAPFFNYDYQQYSDIDTMQKELGRVGLYAENCTSWYSAVYVKESP